MKKLFGSFVFLALFAAAFAEGSVSGRTPLPKLAATEQAQGEAAENPDSASAAREDAATLEDAAQGAVAGESAGGENAPLPAPPAENDAPAEATGESADAANVPAELPPVKPIGIDYPEGNELVQKYLDQYTSDYGKKWLAAVMENGAPYRGYIRAKIAEMGLPECLEFLPVIESSFRIDALSKSGAMGLWQFMKNSIAPFGMRVNEWMDERCDPWLSTDAALQKLKENHDALGDWCLALAAYNSGLGAISKVQKTYGSSDYWRLAERKKLKAETIQYVPKFVAIAHILTNAERYGIALPEYDETKHQSYAVLPVKRNMDIGVIAELAEIDGAELQFLNPALLYGATPPDVEYGLRVPASALAKVQEIVADGGLLLLKYHLYTVRSGDTLYALAKHYGVSVEMIEEANPGLKPNALRIGAKISIPAFKDVAPYAGRVQSKSVEYNGTHVVQKGENLWNISLRYNVQVEELAESNNIQVNAILREGTKLKVPILR